MKLVIRAFILWGLLGALAWLTGASTRDFFTEPQGSVHTHLPAGFDPLLTTGIATAVIPAFCMWLTMTAVPLLPRHWLGRLAFWLGTVAVWLWLVVVIRARAEFDPIERAVLLFSGGVTLLIVAWLSFRVRPFPVWRIVGEIAVVCAIYGVIAGAALYSYNAGTRALGRRAEARWAEIGLPLNEFEKTLGPGQENAGSEVLRQVLREQVYAHFYKDGTRAGKREPAIVQPQERRQLFLKIAQMADATQPPSDEVKLSAQSAALTEPLGPSLDADYRRILAAEPATWASNPHDGYFIDVPNFIGIRHLAQLAAADATRRFSEGDQEGAARALSAGLHMSAGLRQNPTLVSLMIYVAVDALIASKRVHLPAEEGGLQAVAKDATDLQSEFLKRLQLEGWLCLHSDVAFGNPVTPPTPGPRWLTQIYDDAQFQRQTMMAALNGAEHAAILKDPATRSLPDLGESRYEAVSEAHPTYMEFNASRAMMRITASLLLREQAELIRLARTRLATGTPMEPYQSAVIPVARWELVIDPEKATVSTRLVGTPDWILKNEVTKSDFWCLPLDGSVAWQFHRPVQAVSNR